MNVTLRDVEFVDAAKNRKKFSHFFVPCRLIRYVQIPTEIDIKEAIHKRFGKFEVFKIVFFKFRML